LDENIDQFSNIDPDGDILDKFLDSVVIEDYGKLVQKSRKLTLEFYYRSRLLFQQELEQEFGKLFKNIC